MAGWKLPFFFVATLGCVGCSGSDTMLILMRDVNAIEAEVADSLIMVVDESSAQSFVEQRLPRYKNRLEKLKGRIEMWEKYASEEHKKIKGIVDKVREVGVKKKDEKDHGELEKLAFDLQEGYRLLREQEGNRRRLAAEESRIRAVVGKLAAAEALKIQESWQAIGRLDVPRIGPGLDVDPQKNWPFLYKLQDARQEVFGGKGVMSR